MKKIEDKKVAVGAGLGQALCQKLLSEGYWVAGLSYCL